jgi:histone H3/H4
VTEDRVPEATPWRRCSACKKPIALGAVYWTCNVSTCNQKRTALSFCSVSCWEVHLPGANHREAWAVEKRAPKTPEAGAMASVAGVGGVRRLVRSTAPSPAKPASAPEEVLIVASRLKDYVRARSGYNTSDRVLEPLSEIVRRIVDQAIENARRDGRMTVLDRDIPES